MVERVRVRALMPPGHVRTPAYLRGRSGVVERALGPFPDPERRAYGQTGPDLPLFRVRFTMAELWGKDAENPADTLDAEIYGPWLERLD